MIKNLVFGFCFLLAACSPVQFAGVSVPVTQSVLPPQDIATLKTDCSQAQGLINVATGPMAPAPVSGQASYLKAYCDQLNAGVVPPTTDANTVSWWSNVLAGVKIAAQVAAFVLPLL